MRPEPPRTPPGIAGYRLRELVGRGSSSEVYRAEPVDAPGRVVAVKLVWSPDGGQRLGRLRHQTLRLAELEHPAIVRVREVVEMDGGVALVTDYLAGGSLAGRIRAREAGLAPAEVVDLGRRVAEALACAHQAGIVHRDVKPSNVLFTGAGDAVLADFGEALVASGGGAREVVGTAEYLDPAVAGGAAPGPGADIYGLGVVLYEALAGRPPFAGSSPEATLRAADEARCVPLAELAVGAGAELVEVIERAMARDPDRRWREAEDLSGALADLEPAAEGPRGGERAIVPGGGPGHPGPVERSTTRRFGPLPAQPVPSGAVTVRWWLVLAAGLVALIPAVTAWWLLAGAAG